MAAKTGVGYNIQMVKNKNSHFGLNISDHSLRFAKIVAVKDGLKLEKFGERKIPSGVVEFGEIKNAEKLEKFLTALKKEENLKFAHLSLPLIVLQKHMIKNYLYAFEHSGIKILSLEFEAQSLARLLIKKGDLETHMLVDFGEKTTGIYIVSDGAVKFASTFNFGGVELSNLIQENLNLTFEEAEKVKKEYGLQQNTKNKKAFPILLDGVSFLYDEIARHFLHWHTRKVENKKNPIEKIIFCGGSSNLLGLADYFSARMKNPVEIADVWVNLPTKEKNVQELSFKQSLSFAPALGVALLTHHF
jgi:Tfp pilus assembly PilM family ATPase